MQGQVGCYKQGVGVLMRVLLLWLGAAAGLELHGGVEAAQAVANPEL
jgi:hypothetical protein